MPRQLTALLIEDDDTNRSVFALVLQSSGFKCTPASNGAEGLRFVKDNVYDLIVVDWMLPDIDGPTLISTIRTSPTAANAKFIVLTAKDEDVDDLAKAFDSGVQAHDVYHKMLGPVVIAGKFKQIAAEMTRTVDGESRLEQMEANLMAQGQRLDDHISTLEQCSRDKDVRIDEVRDAFAQLLPLIEEIQRNTAQTKEIVKVWAQAKAVGGGVRTVAVVIWTYKKQIAFASGLITAIYMWSKTGVWHFAWPK